MFTFLLYKWVKYMPDINLSHCRNLDFSADLSEQRLTKFINLWDPLVLKRLLCVCLFLLGAKRSKLAGALGLPTNAAHSVIKAVTRDGLPALEDRRKSSSSFLPPAPITSQTEEPFSVSFQSTGDGGLLLDLNTGDHSLLLPDSRPLQKKVILLSLLDAGLVTSTTVADLLGCSSTHVGKLAAKLADGDADALIDQRRGQQNDYLVDETAKGQLIEQFVLALATDGKVSARSLAERLKDEYALDIAPRTVGFHMNKLGLIGIKKHLINSLAIAKKNSGN